MNKTNTSLGRDLPNTEEELFQLDVFPIYDQNFLTQNIRNPTLIAELLNEFISPTTQNDIHLLIKAQEQKDWETVEQLAHKIKGGAAYLGIKRMMYACQYLERYYKAGHKKLLDELAHQLLEVNAQTIEYIKNGLK